MVGNGYGDDDVPQMPRNEDGSDGYEEYDDEVRWLRRHDERNEDDVRAQRGLLIDRCPFFQ